MPKLREVLSLQELSLIAIGQLILQLSTVAITDGTIHSRSPRGAYIEQFYNLLQKYLFTNLPHYLYDAVAAHVFKIVHHLMLSVGKALSFKQCNVDFSDLSIIVRLTDIVFTKNLKRLELWYTSIFVQYHVCENLNKLSGLEVLDLGGATYKWNTRNNTTSMIEGIKVMKNLKKLCLHHYCNDEMVQALGDNCRKLGVLDISSSHLVSDRSMCYLIKCEKLVSVQLLSTSVTMSGFTTLIVGLPNLRDIGQYNNLDDVFMSIFNNSLLDNLLELRKFETVYLSPDCLKALVKMSPNVEHIGLFHTFQITDLRNVLPFKNLKELKLSFCSFYMDLVSDLLKGVGIGINTLYLKNIRDFDSNAIIHISQCCPNLRTLFLKNCHLMDELQLNLKLKVEPFQNLESLFWQSEWCLTNVKFILSHAVNIRIVDFGASVDITHSIIEDLLENTQMNKIEELRISFSTDFRLETVYLLLSNCSQLCLLTNLRNCFGMSTRDMTNLREYVKANNIDLKTVFS